MPRVEVLHGVNLDQLGKRKREHYGTLTLVELEVRIRHWSRQLGLEVSFSPRTPSEFVERLHQAPELADALLQRPWRLDALQLCDQDALEIAERPTVEVHLSDVTAREEWRRHSVLSDLVLKQVSGKGVEGYREALEVLAKELGVLADAA